MNIRRFATILIAIVSLMPASILAQNHTISGYVTDAKSGETLIYASVFDSITLKGTVSNEHGYYSLTIPAEKVCLQASYVGYGKFRSTFMLDGDKKINIALDSDQTLDEVTIIGEQVQSNVRSSQMSAVEIPISQITKVPTLFSEVDIIKVLQLLPGVQSGTEGSAGLYVRGGGPDENLFLLDGIPMYNVNHLFGFFSAFNADAIKNVTLYKGDFPARFGGRLSSVVDVRMKDGDLYEYHGNASIGLIASKINVEGPIVKGKTSFELSARRTYLDILAAPFIAIYSGEDDMRVGSYFYDLNLKVNHKFSDKDRLFLSLYSGDDAAYLNYKSNSSENGQSQIDAYMKDKWKWGNFVTSLRWNHVITPKLFMNVTGAYTQYRHSLGINYEETQTVNESGTATSITNNMQLAMNSGIYDVTAKADFDYNPIENHEITFGANITHHRFKPSTTSYHYKDSGSIGDIGTTLFDTIIGGNSNIGAIETSAYFEDDWAISNLVKADLGLHFSTFTVNKKTYTSLQPRVSIRTMINENLSIKAGYAYMSQYIHLLCNNSISLPTDLWVPTTEKISPMNSHQVALGVFYDMKGYQFSSEVFYKHMDNILEYKDGASFFTLDQTNWDDKVVMGEGKSYGIEFLARKQFGKTTGWIGYTLSKAERLFDREGQELNFGKPFPAKYDRRHDISIVVSHEFSDRFDMGLTYVFCTGNCATLSLQDYQGINDNIFGMGSQISYISSRNNFRFNNYQRVDLGFNFHKQKKYGVRTWNISVYNATSHNNPFIVYVDNEGYYDETTGHYIDKRELKQICLFPIIPTASWSFKF